MVKIEIQIKSPKSHELDIMDCYVHALNMSSRPEEESDIETYNVTLMVEAAPRE